MSDIKSNDQRWPGRRATGIGVGDPRVRLRPLRRLTPSFLLFDYPKIWASLKRLSRICVLLRRVRKLYIKVRKVSGAGQGRDVNHIAAELQLSGKAVFSTTIIHGKPCLRAGVVNHRTTSGDIREAIVAVEDAVRLS